jgi:hypothetical protein
MLSFTLACVNTYLPAAGRLLDIIRERKHVIILWRFRAFQYGQVNYSAVERV